MKKYIIFFLCITFMIIGATVVLAADETFPAPRVVKDRPLRVGYGAPNMSGLDGIRAFNQAKIDVKHRGWELIPIVDALEIEQQRNGMKSFINQDVDAIIIAYWVMEPLRDLIIEARKKGIGVYSVDGELRPGVIVNTAQQHGTVGCQMFTWGREYLESKGKMLIFSIPTSAPVREDCLAVKGLTEAFPGIEVVGFENLPSPGWQKAAYDLTIDYLTKYGGELRWIFAGWDDPALLAAKAAESLGYTRDDIIVTGFNGGKEAYDAIRKRSSFIATVSQPLEANVHVCFDVIHQVQIEGIAPGEKGSMIPSSRMLYTSATVTTFENLPPEGASVHEVFDYYDPNDKDAWYFWGEPYKI